ncbi:diguanylate cyclase [Halomonas sp. ANAO-440]|uniref:diguanylate cyclase n=1 Tax=Halomonas sp. ANAO-440 TaxID=2861360 RepID=UPI002934C6E0|nr:diguanylate cyclase [Halomonas sp. ANAO-440]
MTFKLLAARLIMAVTVPVILVTATLYPIFQAHLDARLDSTISIANAKIEAGERSLKREVNASINHLLATAEMPLLKRYLNGVGVARSPFQEEMEQITAAQLHTLLDTLLPHYVRYTQFSLMDLDGRELLRVGQDPIAQAENHVTAIFFREAMTLAPRDLYISPPRRHLPHESGHAVGIPVMDITTPVFDTEGTRKGVLRFTLDWEYLAADIEQNLAMDAWGHPFMVDAEGTWLLTETKGPLSFGGSFAADSPEVWKALQLRHRGKTILSNRLVIFSAYDTRTYHYQSLAGMVVSHPGRDPWQLGVIIEKPSLGELLAEDVTPLLITLLLYVLSITFGVFWAISYHRQQRLRHRTQRLSHEAHQYAHDVRDLYENAPCGYHSLDSDGRVVKINRTELNWLGYSAAEVIGKRLYRDFITPETREAFDTAFQGVLGPDQEGSAECALLTRSGERLPVIIQATAYIAAHGFVHSRAMVFDLSERKQMEETLAQQAMTDPLTGLGNRRFLQDQAAMEIARARRSGAPLGLIVIDLDHFKRINDEYGHDVGDIVLQAFARTAKEQLREGDVLCRMGGEEFAVLLPDTTQHQAIHVAERLRQALETSSVEVDHELNAGRQLNYTASLGVTLVMADEPSLKPAIKRADRGLYLAKEQGRNQVNWQNDTAD